MFERIVAEAPEFFSYYNIIFLAQAFAATFGLAFIGCVTGFCAGFVIAVVRRTHGWTLAPLRWLLILFVEFFRRVPVLVVLMLVFFSFSALDVDFDLFTVALIAMFFVAAAYLAEIVRSGFDSVNPMQWDAAWTMNFSYLQTIRYVVVPQSWPVIVPPVFSFFLLFIKETALVSQLGVLELTYAGKVMNNKGFSGFLVFGVILVLYFAMSYPLTRVGRWLEGRIESPRDR